MLSEFSRGWEMQCWSLVKLSVIGSKKICQTRCTPSSSTIFSFCSARRPYPPRSPHFFSLISECKFLCSSTVFTKLENDELTSNLKVAGWTFREMNSSWFALCICWMHRVGKSHIDLWVQHNWFYLEVSSQLLCLVIRPFSCSIHSIEKKGSCAAYFSNR